MIYTSAPSYPHGAIDPIAALSEIALAYDCCLHVDACLGGFVLPFLKAEISTIIFDFEFKVNFKSRQRHDDYINIKKLWKMLEF